MKHAAKYGEHMFLRNLGRFSPGLHEVTSPEDGLLRTHLSEKLNPALLWYQKYPRNRIP
jgi:hypothetical protein